VKEPTGRGPLPGLAMLHVNDEFTKKQLECAKPSATPAKIDTFHNKS
jgi:hypothetical protein